MGKQRDKHPFIEDSSEWMGSPLKQSASVKCAIACGPCSKKLTVDAKNRKIILEGGQRLSIAESVQRTHAQYPDFPLELIETHVIGWLEMEFAPPTYSEKQLDELDQLTEKWIEDHERQVEAGRKRGRTRQQELGTLEQRSRMRQNHPH